MHAEQNINKAPQVFFIATLCAFLIGCSVDMFVPSLPAVSQYFHAPGESARMMVTVYLITYGVFQLLGGSLADSFGRRKIMLFTLAGYSLIAFCIPFSQDITTLLILRAVQGIFVAGFGVVSRTLISDCYRGSLFRKRAPLLTMIWASGVILSPFIGGYLQHLFNWKMSFFVLGSFAFMITVLAFILLCETNPKKHQFHVRVIFHNYKTVYSCTYFLSGALVCGLAYSIITMYNVVGPFLVEQGLHYSPVVYGRIALLLGAACLLGNYLCRRLADKSYLENGVKLALWFAIVIAGFMLVLGLSGQLSLASTIIFPTFLFIVSGVVFAFNFARSLSYFPQMAGVASAALGGMFSTFAGVFSGLASLLKAQSLVPIASAFLLVVVLALVIFKQTCCKELPATTLAH